VYGTFIKTNNNARSTIQYFLKRHNGRSPRLTRDSGRCQVFATIFIFSFQVAWPAALFSNAQQLHNFCVEKTE
ncbi:hypothetical protein ACLFKT_42205, partial [Paraburkholderia sp. BR14261]